MEHGRVGAVPQLAEVLRPHVAPRLVMGRGADLRREHTGLATGDDNEAVPPPPAPP